MVSFPIAIIYYGLTSVLTTLTSIWVYLSLIMHLTAGTNLQGILLSEEKSVSVILYNAKNILKMILEMENRIMVSRS